MTAMARIIHLVVAGFVGLGSGTAAFAADLPIKAPPPIQVGGSFWLSAEYLLWSAKGDRLPPLVTTSPPGTPVPAAGVLGLPSTSVLFGNEAVNDRWRSGARLRAGYWFDPARTVGVEASFFMLGNASTGFSAASNGTPILARPFFNALLNQQDTVLIAFPGVSSGQIAISDTSRVFGGSAAFRKEVCANCFGGRIDGLVGYRYLRLADRLGIITNQISLNPFFAGLIFATSEEFDTRNDFHGLDLGLTGDLVRGPWTFTWLAKVAVGGTFSQTRIAGATTTTAPGFAPVTTPGAVLAQLSNIGTFNSNRLSAVPELSASVSYRISPNVRVFAGYNLIYWSGVARPGGAIDTVVDFNQPGGLRPTQMSNTSDYWLQGVNFGLAFNF
jgi:hypothetical protein